MTDEKDEPRVVCRYQGAQIEQTREYVWVVLRGKPKPGVRGALRHVHDFERVGTDQLWRRRHSPAAAFAAQDACREFYGEEIQP